MLFSFNYFFSAPKLVPWSSLILNVDPMKDRHSQELTLLPHFLKACILVTHDCMVQYRVQEKRAREARPWSGKFPRGYWTSLHYADTPQKTLSKWCNESSVMSHVHNLLKCASYLVLGILSNLMLNSNPFSSRNGYFPQSVWPRGPFVFYPAQISLLQGLKIFSVCLHSLVPRCVCMDVFFLFSGSLLLFYQLKHVISSWKNAARGTEDSFLTYC